MIFFIKIIHEKIEKKQLVNCHKNNYHKVEYSPASRWQETKCKNSLKQDFHL